jgi:hypothetical protein
MPPAELTKHMKYKSMYKSNTLFWGLGIEEETYFQFTKPIHVAAPCLRINHKPERYSVKYFSAYKESYADAIAKLFPDSIGFVGIPYFLNAHAFNRIDTNGQHKTTYEKFPKSNKRFSGKTFFEELTEFKPLSYSCRITKPVPFARLFETSCTFDGDSIEFMTQKFYNATVDSVIDELCTSKQIVLEYINTFIKTKGIHRDKGLLQYPITNPGFVVQYTNPGNITMFNNGTYHINITLPTQLGPLTSQGIPSLVHPEKFKKDHQRFIRCIQWMEPFVIGMYGTPDPLSAVSELYSKASQRCAVSRYIGICTYDTNAMKSGKNLTESIHTIRGSNKDFWWYKKYHATSGYTMLNEIGLDISYNKHHNHGVEIRFLEWFPETMLKGLISFYVNLADASLGMEYTEEPIMSEVYNILIVQMLREGRQCTIPRKALILYEKIFGFSFKDEEYTLEDVFTYMRDDLRVRYSAGVCAKYML